MVSSYKPENLSLVFIPCNNLRLGLFHTWNLNHMGLKPVPRQWGVCEKRKREGSKMGGEEVYRLHFSLTVITSLEAHWSPQAKENSYDWKMIRYVHMLIGWLVFSFS